MKKIQNFNKKSYSNKKGNSDKKEIIFGIRPVIESISSGVSISKVFLNRTINSDILKELISLTKQSKIPVSNVPNEKLNKITNKQHQGVVAFISPIRFASLENIVQNCFEKGVNPKILILDNITDTRNLGAIIRSASCFQIDAIVLPFRGAQITSDTMKTSVGALAYVPICREENLENSINYLHNSGMKIVSLTEKCDEKLFDANLNIPIALILGSEDEGISESILKLSDLKLKIPILGPIKSLNVSSAASIACYEILKQRL